MNPQNQNFEIVYERNDEHPKPHNIYYPSFKIKLTRLDYSNGRNSSILSRPLCRRHLVECGRNGTDYEDSDDFNSSYHDRYQVEDEGELGDSGQEENEEGGIFSRSNPFSCCGSEKFQVGLDLDKHYKDCSTAPPDEFLPFHMNYWRMYEFMASRSLADGQSMNAYNYAHMMTLNLSSEKRAEILDLVNEFQSEMSENSTRANGTQYDASSSMEVIMETYLLAKYRVCNGNESFNDTNNATMTEEIVGNSLSNCRNHSYPNIPLFPVSMEKVQECLEDQDGSKIFKSLHINKREIVCVYQADRSSRMVLDNNSHTNGTLGLNLTDIAPQFYSASVLSDIESAAYEDSPPNLGATLNEGQSEEDEQVLAEVQGVVDAYVYFKRGVEAYCSGKDDETNH